MHALSPCICMFQSELKVVQEEFRDAMTENAALEGEVSQLTYEVRHFDSQYIQFVLYVHHRSLIK